MQLARSGLKTDTVTDLGFIAALKAPISLELMTRAFAADTSVYAQAWSRLASKCAPSKTS